MISANAVPLGIFSVEKKTSLRRFMMFKSILPSQVFSNCLLVLNLNAEGRLWIERVNEANGNVSMYHVERNEFVCI